jgi:diguanylate cyclase (GGDEF)-like protein
VHAARNNTQFALLYVDLDKFKSVNDTAGHAVGDLALQEAAHRFKEVLRASDTVARFGGDEFIVLLEELHKCDDATQVAEQISTKLHESCVVQGHNIFLAGSVGIAIFPENGQTADELINFADTAMYRVKKT